MDCKFVIFFVNWPVKQENSGCLGRGWRRVVVTRTKDVITQCVIRD